MYRLRTLGSLELRDVDGVEVRPVIAQPRRAALLAYLAIASSGSFHRRDRLLPLFWPEQDAERARAALNRAIYFLRRELGADVIISRGDEVAVDATRLWCDARAFETAIQNAELPEAFALYRGDLLLGFFPSGAPGFEQWLEVERSRLRQRASQAARVFADQHARNDDFSSAALWARRSVELSPFDEVGVRRLLTLLDRAGDRAGAAQAYRHFADGIAAELELAPSPETQALFEKIRSRDHARDAPSALSEHPPIDAESVTPPDAVADRTDDTRTNRRPRRWLPKRALMPGLAAVLIIGAIAATRLRGVDPTLVRVASFENVTDDTALSDLARLASARVATDLQHAALFKHVESPNERSHRWRRPALLVSGTIRSHQGKTVLDAAIKDVRTGGTVWALPTIAVSDAPADSIVARLQSRVLGGVAAIRDVASARFFPIAASTPPTLEAFVEYGEGRELAEQHKFAEAIKRFRWAAVLDTMFTWPLVEAAVTALQFGERAPADSTLVALTRVRDRLTPLQQDVIAFVEASRAENWPEARRALRLAAQLAPERYAYRYAISATHVNRPGEVVTALSYPGLDTLSRNPALSYWNVLTLAYHQLGDHEIELAMARRARSRRRGSLVALTQEIRSLAALGRPAKVLSLLDSAASLPREGWFTPAWSMETAARELRAHGHSDAARAALERAVAWHRHRPSEEESTEARRAQLADVFYLLGDLDNAEREYAALSAMDTTNAYYLAALGAIAGRRGRRTAAESISVRLQMMERAVPVPGNDAVVGRARIAALLGDHRQALGLLVQAFGPAGTNMLHDDVDFEGLRNDPRFREFIRPKG